MSAVGPSGCEFTQLVANHILGNKNRYEFVAIVANAMDRDSSADVDEMVIKEAYANEASTLKRFRPRAMGRASRIHKRSSHITIVVESAN